MPQYNLYKGLEVHYSNISHLPWNSHSWINHTKTIVVPIWRRAGHIESRDMVARNARHAESKYAWHVAKGYGNTYLISVYSATNWSQSAQDAIRWIWYANTQEDPTFYHLTLNRSKQSSCYNMKFHTPTVRRIALQVHVVHRRLSEARYHHRGFLPRSQHTTWWVTIDTSTPSCSHKHPKFLRPQNLRCSITIWSTLAKIWPLTTTTDTLCRSEFRT